MSQHVATIAGVRVLADPWDPGYGMGFSIDEDLADAAVDTTAETRDWSVPIPGVQADRVRVAFVDGVRRVELRLMLAEGDVRAAGALGSLAVGAVFCGRDTRMGEQHLARRFVIGGSFTERPRLSVTIGASQITWEPLSVPGDDDLSAQLAIHNEMRSLEAQLARRIAEGEADVVLVDGPLGYLDVGPVPTVGVVKRSVRRYLEGTEAALIPRLDPGTRTPLFRIGEGTSSRLSWYARVAPLRTAWHDHAGLLRCELSAQLPLSEACELADRVTGLLPRYAGNPSDPRTPQNLGPVASLERRLKHSLGDELLIRRRALAELTRRERSAS